MITADYHLHTSFSGDSDAPMEQMVERAVSLGLTRVCFTDHLDLDYPAQEIKPGETADAVSPGSNPFLLDLPAYFHKLEELQHRYRNQIEIRFGIEMGMIDSAYSEYHTLLQQYPFDFNIASSHLVDRLDPYYPAYWQAHTDSHAAVCRYFDSTLEHMNAYTEFDTYGHLDYIVRYSPDRRSYSYEEYADRLDAILLRLLELDKALEVNTGGYKYGLGVPNPQPEVLKRYRELGGEMITIGSDAHAPEHLAYDFTACQELLLSLGYRYYAVYDGHRPAMRRL